MASEPTKPFSKPTGHRWRAILAWTAILVLALAAIVAPPEAMRGTIVTLLIIGGLGLAVWRLPMADDDS